MGERDIQIKEYYDEMTNNHTALNAAFGFTDHLSNLSVHREINGDVLFVFKHIETYLQTHLTNSNEKWILDAGCGYGGALIHLGKKFPQHHYFGVTLSPKQAEVGKMAVQKNNLSKSIELQVRNYLDLEQKFDFIITIESLNHSKDVKSTLQTWKNNLQKDGRILVIEDIVKDSAPMDDTLQKWKELWLENPLRISEFEQAAKDIGYKIEYKEDLFAKFGYPLKTEAEIEKLLEDQKKTHPGLLGSLLLDWLYIKGHLSYMFYVLQI